MSSHRESDRAVLAVAGVVACATLLTVTVVGAGEVEAASATPTATVLRLPGATCTGDLSRFVPPLGGMTRPRAALPSDAQAACLVRSQRREHRPSNAKSKVKPPYASLRSFRTGFVRSSGGDERARRFANRVTGRKTTGTTDEIIQWAAYKWGIDPNILRAVGVSESSWYQAHYLRSQPVKWYGFGDFERRPCTSRFPASRTYVYPDGTRADRGRCPQSFGFVQWKFTAWPGSFPHSIDSLPFNLDAFGARMRTWYEGYSYCGARARGDMWHALDSHYSGDCNRRGRVAGRDTRYVSGVKSHLARRPWRSASF